MLHLDLDGGKNSDQVDDLIVMELANKCSWLKSLNLSQGVHKLRMKITIVGISKIVEGCLQLQLLNLYGCREVTDIGVSKIGERCSQLQSLDLTY